MGRRPRPIVPGALYHVMGSAVRGEAIFADEPDRECFLRLVRDVTTRDAWSVSAWRLHEDGYEFAIRAGRVGLPRSMRLLVGGFAQEYNRRHHLAGPLWQGRYRATLVDDADLVQLVAYVHRELSGAGAEGTTRGCRCGHGELTGQEKASVIAVGATLGAMGQSREEALAAYQRAATKLWLTAEPTPPEAWGKVSPAVRPDESAAPRLSAAQVLSRACSLLGVDVERLASRRRDRETAALRELVATVAVEKYAVAAVELARLLGKHPDWVSHWAGRGARRRATDSEYRAQLEALEQGLQSVAERVSPPKPEPHRGTWAVWM